MTDGPVPVPVPGPATGDPMSALIEAMPVAVLIVDARGLIAKTNARVEQLFGYVAADLQGRPVECLLPERFRVAHPALRERFAASPVPRAMGAGRPLSGRRADGSEFPLEIGLNALEFDGGRFIVATVVDISEREQTRRLRRAVEELERSNMELQRFAYVASHDLQTPMRSIASFLQLLQTEYGDRLDAQGKDWIRRVVAAVHQLQRLVRDLLEYSRLDVGTQRFTGLSLRSVVDDALLLLDAAIRESGAEIETGDLPEIRGDRSQLLQLFQNLIGNAIKYRGSAPPRISIGAERQGEGWQLWVRDNGIGIAPQHLERIFEIFERLHDQSRYAGTGIGLAVCRRIVAAHGGRIWVESEPGAGSVFRVYLPGRQKEPA